MKRQIISLLLVLAAISALGQNVSAGNPGWLWTINGSGLPGRSFLFGTCHVGCSKSTSDARPFFMLF